jgi:hypothetical protein
MRNSWLYLLLVAVPMVGCVASESPDESTSQTMQEAQSAVCTMWECSWNVCGYDTATDPRGACCVAWEGGYGAKKPSCDADPTFGSDIPSSADCRKPQKICSYHPDGTIAYCYTPPYDC